MAASIAIIGAGPAGLMAAQTLSEAGYSATVFDSMPSAARKFLQAGRGGLNLTHHDDFSFFISQYGKSALRLTAPLKKFTPNDMRNWTHNLGFETFIGSSGKIYPLDKKAAPLLRAWLQRLKQHNIAFKMKHPLTRWQTNKTNLNSASPLTCTFDTPNGEKTESFDAIILALGGASWPHLGSTGNWTTFLADKGVQIAPFKPANMGFNVVWSNIFVGQFSGQPLKNIELSFTTINGKKFKQLGELTITEYGVQGSLIYTHSSALREQLEQHTSFTITLDLLPHRTEAQLTKQLSVPRGKLSLSAFWKRCGIEKIKTSLLREVHDRSNLDQPNQMAKTLKAFPLTLQSPRPIAEAISTAGGVSFDAVNSHLMLTAAPGVFCAGEMLDWEAPTGGYLLTAVMAQGKHAAHGVIDFLENQHPQPIAG